MWWIIGVLILTVFIAIYIIYNTSKRKEAMLDNIKDLPEFNSTQTHMGDDGISGIAIDDNNRKICFIKYNKNAMQTKIISYKDLLSSEILVDGNEVVKTSRTSQIGGALLGGILAGGVGAIIGGLSGTKSSSQKVKSIILHIVVNDSSEPSHIVNFLNAECKTDSFLYQHSIKKARHWQSLLSVLIKQADNEDKDKTTNNSKIFSSADEIYKLSELLKQGIINQDEFDIQKKKLLDL